MTGSPDSESVLTRQAKLFDGGALIDLLIILAVLVIVKQSVLPFSYLYAGPASTFSAMLVATILLRRRGLRWKNLGLRWPENWWKTIGLTLLSMVAFIAATQTMQLFADAFFDDVGTSGRFDHIEGNPAAYIGIMHHYYQGIHGALITGAGGFAFAMLYLWFGRKNIMPLIFAHGIFNSLGQTFRFLGIRV